MLKVENFTNHLRNIKEKREKVREFEVNKKSRNNKKQTYTKYMQNGFG